MAKFIIAVTVFIVILLINFVWLFILPINSEALSTKLKYIFEDVNTKHGSKNLMLGSSSIKKIDQDNHLACGRWLNRGIGNSSISNLSNYIKITPLSIKPSKILLYAGENDISNGISISEATSAYKKLIATLTEKYPESDIHVIAIKPSPARQAYWDKFSDFNDRLEVDLEDRKHLFFHSHHKGDKGYNSSSFSLDGIHLTEQGYEVFTSGLNKTCKTN